MNSLIITLPSEVSDNSIRRLNEARFEIGNQASEESKKAIGVALDAPGLIRCPDGHMYFNNGGTPGTVPLEQNAIAGTGNMTYWWFATPGSHVLLSAKENIVKLSSTNSVLKGNLSELKYSPRLNELDLGSETEAALTGSIEDISSEVLSSIPLFKVRGPGVYGNISVFSGNESLEQLLINGTDCEGDITSLAACTELTRIRFNNSGVTGNVDDLADGLYSNGKTSGTLTYTYNSSGSAVTYTFSPSGWTKQ